MLTLSSGPYDAKTRPPQYLVSWFQPRVVEYEQAVGRALATTEDPDYDVSDNKLYTGEANIMIRPYPLPGSVKVLGYMCACYLTWGVDCRCFPPRVYAGQEYLLRNAKDTVIKR